MNPGQQGALTKFNLGWAAMKVGSDVRATRAAAEEMAARAREQGAGRELCSGEGISEGAEGPQAAGREL